MKTIQSRINTYKKHCRIIQSGLVTFSLSVILTGCLSSEKAVTEQFEKPIPDVVDFNFDVKPILSDTCFLCHGPDKENAKGGLSLDTFEHATSHITDNKIAAIVAGDAESSEAFQRIMSDDPNFIMPPPNSNLVLSARDKEVLKRWIEQGAEYKKHWSFITPEKQPIPEVKQSEWVKNEIDHFILKQIEDNQLTPNDVADKESLIRRVTFDLTGLPPTLAEIDEFLQDNSANAYAKLVDRLMAKPAYGERMAQEWLDVARYADTHGYSTDYYRDMSPYKDWVIDSFNKNQPFDQFITWQLAGDLLPNPTTEQRLATAFNRVHAQNGEGGIINEEFRVEYVKDRVQTLGTGLLGMTMHCAQCHDHKYDPISAKAYYQTTAFFNNLDESGQISYDPNDMPVPTMLLPSESEQNQLTALTKIVEQKQNALANIQTANQAEFASWLKQNNTQSWDTSAKEALIAFFPILSSDSNEKIANKVNPKQTGKVIFGSNLKKKEGPKMQHVVDTHQQADGQKRQAIKLNGDDPLYFPELNHFSRSQPFSISIDTWLPKGLTEGVLFHYNKAGILYNFKGFDVGIEDNHWHVRFAHTYPYNAISLKSTQPAKREQWLTVSLAYDGSSTASGVKFYINGEPVDVTIERDNLYKEIKHNKPNVIKEMGLKVGARWRSRGVANALVDNLKVYNRALSDIELIAQGKPLSSALLTKVDSKQQLAYYNSRYNSAYRQALIELTQARQALYAAQERIQEVMVMEEMKTPRQAYILLRGGYANHGEAIEPGVPETIFPYDKSWPKNRLGLAKWITDKNNPLVARVIINRYWQLFFAKGIVRTPEDFGNQGKRPTHPALLDWLAVEFIESGWDVKHMVKLMVNSATYQQSSYASELVKQKDPENILYAHAPNSRLTAEMLRDNILAASGLLINKIGGKSVHPYQPEGIWKMNNMDYVQGHGEELYRRSMYTIYKRSTPPPNMTNFDAPMRSYSIGVRQATNTPLQALTLLNDPQVVEASRVLAANVMRKETELDKQLNQVFRLLTSRLPSEKERAILQLMYQEILTSFEQAPDKAEAFLSVGEFAAANDLNQLKLAALGSVSNMLVNHDSAVIKR